MDKKKKPAPKKKATTKKKEPSKKMGRKPFEPTDKQRGVVETLAALEFTQTEIAQHIGISPNTLTKYFKDELQLGWIKIIAAVGNVVLNAALKDKNLGAAYFFLKCRGRGRWRETDKKEIEEMAQQKLEDLLKLQDKLEKKHVREY